MNIYVGNLSYDVTEDELRQEFEVYGQVTSVNVVADRYTGRSRGFGFVEMPSVSEGQAAINEVVVRMEEASEEDSPFLNIPFTACSVYGYSIPFSFSIR